MQNKSTWLGALTAGLLLFPAFPSEAKPTRGEITGYKFHDQNGNGVDDNEPRLSGFTILLNSLDFPAVSRSQFTDSEGEFHFDDLPIQRYEVCEIAPASNPPWIPTTPTCVRVRLFDKKTSDEVFFGNRRQENGGSLGCTRTQGFWGSSPAGQAMVPILVPGTMNLGSVAYTASQLDDILDQPVQGNALLILTHQLIAAKLNILAGASNSCLGTEIADADTAIGALVIPPVGSDTVAPASPLGQTMTELSEGLDEYNQGNRCVPHCP